MIDKASLNRKLAIWAGFEEGDIKEHFHYWRTLKIAKWKEPNSGSYAKLPSFTESLELCFEWLVPKIGKGTNSISFLPYMWQEGWIVESWIVKISFSTDEDSDYFTTSAKTPALAFCLAIEKLLREKDAKKRRGYELCMGW